VAFDELETRTADGVTLRIDRVRATGARVRATGGRRGAVLCLHAMMTDGRYFGARREGSFAAALAATGLDVYVADFRGHGRSVPPRAGKDDWSFDDLVELDLPALVAAVPADTAILGHSLGGLAAAAALATGRIPPPPALVLAATSVWLHGPGGPLGRRALMAAYRGITALVGKAPIRALRVGTDDEAATYVAQLTGWTRAARWTSLRGVDYLAALETIRVPTVAIAGTGDWMCRPADAEVLAHRIPTCAPVRVIGRLHGDPLDPDHFELFTRPELGALRAWLATQLG
jgi:alpha-beta hydrolase superfamily lysophospholipase